MIYLKESVQHELFSTGAKVHVLNKRITIFTTEIRLNNRTSITLLQKAPFRYASLKTIMKLEIDITRQDYLNFNLYHFRKKNFLRTGIIGLIGLIISFSMR
jgi:hypothetical protein